jgi:hypothetical protein
MFNTPVLLIPDTSLDPFLDTKGDSEFRPHVTLPGL